jgi:ribosome maturation factor RimP
MTTPLPPDPVIDEIREVRRRISARFDDDPERLVAYYMEVQKQYGDRLLDSEQHSQDAELGQARKGS